MDIMKVGDLVQDWELGLNGIIVEMLGDGALGHFSILYEDGEICMAYENALEVINENR